MQENKNNKNGVNGLTIFIIIIITFLISVPIGYFIGNKLFNNTSTNKITYENTDTVTKTEEDIEEINVDKQTQVYNLTNNDINTIKNMFPNFDYYLENILENAGYESIENDFGNGTFINYITNNLSNNDLLNDEKFKFSFAFIIGRQLYSNKYTASSEVTGLWSINIDDFEVIYNSLFADNYNFENIPLGTKYELNENTIIGSVYTGYFNEMYFDLVTNDNTFTANIYNYDYETSGKGSTYYGYMNLIFEKDDNNLYSIKHFYLNK